MMKIEEIVTLPGNYMKALDANGKTLFRLSYISKKHGGGCDVHDLRTGFRADMPDVAGEEWFKRTAIAAMLETI